MTGDDNSKPDTPSPAVLDARAREALEDGLFIPFETHNEQRRSE